MMLQLYVKSCYCCMLLKREWYILNCRAVIYLAKENNISLFLVPYKSIWSALHFITFPLFMVIIFMSDANVNFLKLSSDDLLTSSSQSYVYWITLYSKVLFHELEEKTDCGEAQCIVTVPANTTFGVGEDMGKAKNKAARAALNYMKILSKD